jgi:epoxide hydrolase 4
MPAVVSDVVRLIEEQGRSCVLVGHDWGAVVAWFVAMLRPDLVKRLVIIGVPHPAVFVRELKRSMRQRLRASYNLFFQLPLLPELFMKIFGKMLMRRGARFTRAEIDEYARAWRGSLTTMLHYYRAMPRTRGQLRPMMKRIDMPVLLLWGADEPVFVREAWQDYDEWCPDIRIVRVENAGHFVQTDAPDVVNESVIAFATPATAPRPTS